MIAFILLIVLFVLSGIGTWICVESDREIGSVLLSIVMSLSFFGVLYSTIEVIDKKNQGEEFVRDRYFHENLVKSINDDMSTATINKIITAAMRDNGTILLHRERVDSKFIGCYYSRMIAEQEYIELPKLTIKTEE